LLAARRFVVWARGVGEKSEGGLCALHAARGLLGLLGDRCLVLGAWIQNPAFSKNNPKTKMEWAPSRRVDAASRGQLGN
jgi:hypothetical protein